MSNIQENNQNKYLIKLYVEDNIGNLLSKEIPITVSYPLGDITNIQLIGEYDCENQAIKLKICGEDEVSFAGYFEGNNVPEKLGKDYVSENDRVLNLNNFIIYQHADGPENDWIEMSWNFEGEKPSNFSGEGIWKDGENTYWSYVDPTNSINLNYRLNKRTRTWESIEITYPNTYRKMEDFSSCCWTDSNGVVHYDNATNPQLPIHLKFNRDTLEWVSVSWTKYNPNTGQSTFYADFSGKEVWKDGEIIYLKNNLVFASSVGSYGVWNITSFTGAPDGLSGGLVWTDMDNNVYARSNFTSELNMYKLTNGQRVWTQIENPVVQVEENVYSFDFWPSDVIKTEQDVFAWGEYIINNTRIEGYCVYIGSNTWKPVIWDHSPVHYTESRKYFWNDLNHTYFYYGDSSLRLYSTWEYSNKIQDGQYVHVEKGEYENCLCQRKEDSFIPISFSIYRREKDFFSNGSESSCYIGEWYPVSIKSTKALIKDFNIKADYSYQYILYSGSSNEEGFVTSFATKEIQASAEQVDGDIFRVPSQFWSIMELEPVDNLNPAIPIIKQQYKVKSDTIWLFKFETEVGSQTQNFTKNEINSLGIYPKVGFGVKNYISGEISCLLGDEIVPYTNEAYIERLKSSFKQPLSTNEKIRMLNKWRQIAYSRNPKLLKDNKGQSWIVQIFSSSNNPYSHYINQPDKISFSWKQINVTDNCIIIKEGGEE